MPEDDTPSARTEMTPNDTTSLEAELHELQRKVYSADGESTLDQETVVRLHVLQ